MARLIKKRHNRRSNYSRLRHSKQVKRFIAQQATRLAASATGQTFTTVPLAPAVGVLTLTGLPLNNETVVIGSKTYTFQDTLTNVDGNVKIGASASISLDNLIAAITLGAGAGTLYAAAMTAHPTVTAAAGAGDTMDVTALTSGSAGNAIATTETLTNGSFGAATLTAGTDALDTAAAHGISNLEGPYQLTTSGTLPAGYALATNYFFSRVDANTYNLSRTRGGPIVEPTSAGSGTHTITKAGDSQAMFEALRKNSPKRIQSASDIDDLS